MRVLGRTIGRAQSCPCHLIRNDRNRFHLNQHVITKESSNLHGRTCGWLLRVNILIAYGTHNGNLGYIEQEIGQFHDVVEARSNRSKRGSEVLEDLGRLCVQVIQPNQVAGRVQCHLPRDINRPTTTRLNHLGIAKRSRHRCWIEKAGW